MVEKKLKINHLNYRVIQMNKRYFLIRNSNIFCYISKGIEDYKWRQYHG